MAGEKLFKDAGRFKVSKATAVPGSAAPGRFSYNTVDSVAGFVLIVYLLFSAILRVSFGIVNFFVLTVRLAP
jgi:hypothetical protein